MSKRKNLELIEDLTAIVKKQGERIDTLQKALDTVLERNPQLVEQDKPKTLNQSVFDGQDEKWRWAAVDGNGSAYLYSDKPKIVFAISPNQWIFGISRPKRIGCFSAENWQNSLIEREAKPLGGNERIKRLLEKQKLVIVKCSDVSYEDAQEGGDWDVCLRYANDETDYQIENGCHAWRYGIPYDQYGNEILDVE